MLMSLHSSCWRYTRTGIDNASSRVDQWLRYYGDLPHIHMGCHNLTDGIFVVAKMDCSIDGKWFLQKSVPYVNESSASDYFKYLKREIRKQFKEATEESVLIPSNSCSFKGISSSFDHLLLNQHVDLYNILRDGSPIFLRTES